MNKDKLWNEVLTYLESHRILTMATATSNGNPDATALEYANKGFIVYVSVRPKSRKVTNMEENPKVFYEIHEDVEITWENVQNLKAIQASATPEILRFDNEGFQEAFDIMEKKFPVFSQIPREKRVIVKFIPNRIWYLNYKEKMFHREELRFDE